ncbi:MAG: tRNA uridine-5-carboxymethylaminomethyl(34) synthesis GTPase MnmE [Betaproteobacteria bacterium]|nr:tRNA uridine-5-carboxymethylaminomethyl(34) synthesis GTPase MnmE [Betaproteobacteria bacterium]
MASADPIAAIATPPGKGGIGVLRMSGPRLAPLAEAILGRRPQPRQAELCWFRDAEGEPIDQGLALFFPGPHSYTGEDVLELHGHGGPAVLHALLQRCLELGARLAAPGEFTRRAFLNDKLDLAQAESVADLIDASTREAARCALRSLHGEFSEAIHGLTRGLIDLRMLVEATLDFPEEEVDVLARANAQGKLDRLKERLAEILATARQGSLLREGIHVVLAGRPNVGKSSLLNCLAGEDVAIVTDIPGTTRDTIRQAVQIHGVPLHLVDTAGLRDSKDKVEQLGMARTRAALHQGDVVVQVVDATNGVTEEDRKIRAEMPPGPALVTVVNKLDLVAGTPRVEREGGEVRVYLSAKTGAGIELLREVVLEASGWRTGSEGVFMARERHLEALMGAAAHLESAAGEWQQLEFLAEELRLAQEELNRITGEFGADDLLGEIFSRFCIGK